MPEKDIQKLDKLNYLLSEEALSKKEFEENFHEVMDVVELMLKKQAEFNQQMTQKMNELYTLIVGKTDASLKELKQGVNELFVEDKIKGIESRLDGRMSAVEQKAYARVSTLRDGKDSKAEDVAFLLSKDFNFAERTRGRTPGDREIRNALQPFVDEIKKMIDERFKKIPKQQQKMGMRKIQVVKRINLSDQLNGEQKEFVLPKDTVDIMGVWGTQFPINFNPTDGAHADWTLVGNTLILTDEVPAPESGQTLWALVEVLFYY